MRTMWCVTPKARRTAVSLLENGTPKRRITTIFKGITSFLRQALPTRYLVVGVGDLRKNALGRARSVA